MKAKITTRKDGDLNAAQMKVLEMGGKLKKAIDYRDDLKAELESYKQMIARINQSTMKGAIAGLNEAQRDYNNAVEANIRANKTEADLQNIRDRRVSK